MMNKLSAVPLPKGSLNAVIALAVAYIVYKYAQGYERLDKVVNQATKPVGQLWSDIDARLGGWSPVEQTDLVIQRWYLDSNYQISDEAWRVLTVMDSNRALMKTLFNGRVMKPEYRDLIGKPIRGV
jgi:hypothetical protein